MSSAVEQVDRLLKDSGAVLVRSNTHEVWLLPDGKKFVKAKTPSCHRSGDNQASELRKLLGLVDENRGTPGERRERQLKKTQVVPIRTDLSNGPPASGGSLVDLQHIWKANEVTKPVNSLKPTDIFVFGSNIDGIHGRGAAKDAVDHYGAIRYRGQGLQGNAYAIPTRGRHRYIDGKHVFDDLSLESIRIYINTFLEVASSRKSLTFYVTAIGCGNAGFTAAQIAPLFQGAPSNCLFDPSWQSFGLPAWASIPRSLRKTVK